MYLFYEYLNINLVFLLVTSKIVTVVSFLLDLQIFLFVHYLHKIF